MPIPVPPNPSAAAGPAVMQPGQPPIGSSPATQPVANRGQEAAGLVKLGVAVRLLESILPSVGVGSEVGKDVLKSLNTLSRHVPAGSQSSGMDITAMRNLLMQAQQMQPQIAAMRAQGGAPPQASPATPMPSPAGAA